MASSKGSPGIHDRPPGVTRGQCIQLNRKGERCKRLVTRGTKLCRYHKSRIDLEEAGKLTGPDPTQGDVTKAGVATRLRHEVEGVALDQARKGRGQTYSGLVVTRQAMAALEKLKIVPTDNNGEHLRGFDPKIVLLDSVHSAWRQRQVWEAMLAAVPETDWAQIGTIPVPGAPATQRGIRIEIIQKNLSEATKVAARMSKLAIDAGIEERLVRLAEDQAAMIADTVRAGVIAAISALQQQGIISPDDAKLAQEAALASAATHLRALAAGAESDVIDGVAQVVEQSALRPPRARRG